MQKKRKIDSLLVILTKVAGGLESVPAAIGQEAGYTLDRSPGLQTKTHLCVSHLIFL